MQSHPMESATTAPGTARDCQGKGSWQGGTLSPTSIPTDPANPARPDLPQLLVQVRGVHQCSLLDFLIVHLLVPGDEEGAQELLHLHCNVHGDRDNEIEEDHERQEVREHPQDLHRKEEKMQPVAVRAQGQLAATPQGL